MDRITSWSVAEGIEGAEAFFAEHAFSPHRHDTYAIGYTTCGVQTFGYRGAERRSRRGDTFVLHPDEKHDGRAANETGYGYRIVYIAPALIARALDVDGLPFVAEPVSADARLISAVDNILDCTAAPADELRRVAALCAFADVLDELADRTDTASARIDIPTMSRVREHLYVAAVDGIALERLEAEHGLDRYTLSRQFRRVFGVSPHRYLTMRRLDRAKDLIRAGVPLAQAAADAGFADQSHLTRQFRRAFGLSPGRWRRLLALPLCHAQRARSE